MARSSILEGFTSPAKGESKKKGIMERHGRRQFLKEKAAKGLMPKNTVGAEIGEDDEADPEEEEESSGEEEMKGEVDGKKLSTASDADSDDVDNTSALQALADNFTVGAADQGSDIEEPGEGSMMGQKPGDAKLSCLVESSDGEDTKESESLATPEDDMYYIEAIKSSRVTKDVCSPVLATSNKQFFLKNFANISPPIGQA
jgi:hypothetical protein